MPLTMNKEVFITCAVTGSGGTQDRSPHVPRSPKEIAESAIKAAKAGAADYAIGAAAGLVGSMSYALMYVLTEKTQKAADAPPPEALCVFVGMVGTAVLVAYIAVWDGPSWCGSDGNHHAALTLGVIFSHGTKPPMINCQDRLGTNVTGEI